jgi:hypothetical protein
MVNQMAKFIPGLANINAPMRELLKESREWFWDAPQEEAFQKIKKVLMSAETMSHYDPKLQTVVSTDASNVGIGATLFQIQKDGTRRPVMYASRSLNDTEKAYAAIEKEALGTVWACERFDQFIRGMKFTVETDHRPLVPLMTSKDLDQVPARILRMRLRMMRYSPSFTHVEGRSHHLADALSRAPVEGPGESDERFVDLIEESVTQTFPINNLITQLKQAQANDEICKEVKRCCLEGWPAYKSDAFLPLHPYWETQAHLTVVEDLLMYDNRIVIPSSERLKMLDRIHQAHQGITKCRMRARKSVWWPRMSTEIREMIQNCKVCRVNTENPIEPLCPSTLPERPWERLGADLFEFQKKHYLLLVDYYSRWIEVRQLKSLSSAATIEALKSIFATHGICDLMVSDNGPQFASAEFLQFTRDYCFTHVTSSPLYPKANGEAERAVQTVKRLWKVTDKDSGLMTYRATPLENGYTPSELLMGRLIQTSLPSIHLQPINPGREQIAEREEAQRTRTKEWYDRKTRELPRLQPNEPVFIKDMQREGSVVKEVSPRSYLVSTSTGVIRRNRAALVDLPTNKQQVGDPDLPESMLSPEPTPDVSVSAEGRAIRQSPQASHEHRVSDGMVAEGRAIRQSPQARPAPSGKVFERPQRSRRLPSRFADYEMS